MFVCKLKVRKVSEILTEHISAHPWYRASVPMKMQSVLNGRLNSPEIEFDANYDGKFADITRKLQKVQWLRREFAANFVGVKTTVSRKRAIKRLLWQLETALMNAAADDDGNIHKFHPNTAKIHNPQYSRKQQIKQNQSNGATEDDSDSANGVLIAEQLVDQLENHFGVQLGSEFGTERQNVKRVNELIKVIDRELTASSISSLNVRMALNTLRNALSNYKSATHLHKIFKGMEDESFKAIYRLFPGPFDGKTNQRVCALIYF